MKMFRKDEGFTLVELMVVVLIIGILVAIAIPVFNAAQASARKSTCQANQRTIAGAIQQYVAQGGTNTEAQCDGLVTGANPLMVTYIKAEPRCGSVGGSTYLVASGVVKGDKGLTAGFIVLDHELGYVVP
jgi:prepilin-type N-terminal cleavage/methylation domain-containing protein